MFLSYFIQSQEYIFRPFIFVVVALAGILYKLFFNQRSLKACLESFKEQKIFLILFIFLVAWILFLLIRDSSVHSGETNFLPVQRLLLCIFVFFSVQVF